MIYLISYLSFIWLVIFLIGVGVIPAKLYKLSIILVCPPVIILAIISAIIEYFKERRRKAF